MSLDVVKVSLTIKFQFIYNVDSGILIIKLKSKRLPFSVPELVTERSISRDCLGLANVQVLLAFRGDVRILCF